MKGKKKAQLTWCLLMCDKCLYYQQMAQYYRQHKISTAGLRVLTRAINHSTLYFTYEIIKIMWMMLMLVTFNFYLYLTAEKNTQWILITTQSVMISCN